MNNLTKRIQIGRRKGNLIRSKRWMAKAPLRFMDRTEEAHIYTDGATTLGTEPKAGWGLVRIDRPAGQEEAEGKLMTKQYGRLTGHQNNYKAEARALLAALCSAPAVMPMHIYIDNLGVVQRWDKSKKEDTRRGSLSLVGAEIS